MMDLVILVFESLALKVQSRSKI